MPDELLGGKQGAELAGLLSRAHWDENDPARDGRVIWLLNELDGICSSTALHHLCIDVVRERRGGKNPAPSIPIDHSEAASDEGIRQAPDQDSRIHDQDIQFAWKALLALRKSECENPEDAVLLLLRVLVETPEIEASFSSQWPIKAIAELLNARDQRKIWDQRSVDNLKEKLARWIAKKKQAFTVFEDFVAFLACIGRKLENPNERSNYTPARRDHRPRTEISE